MAKKRLNRRIFVLILMVCLGLAGVNFCNQYYHRSMARIRTDVNSKSYRDAIKKLDRLLSLPFMKSDEALFLKGLCNYSLGKPNEAVLVWNEIGGDSQFRHDIALKTGEWLELTGDLDHAERVYRDALQVQGRLANEIRHVLIQLLWLEQRFDESAKLIETNWFHQEKQFGPDDTRAIANLRAHLSLDLEVFPIEHVKKRYDMLAEKKQSDTGRLLGLSGFFMKTGDYKNARNSLDAITETQTDELEKAILNRKIQLALFEGDLPNVIKLAKRLKETDIPSPLKMRIVSAVLQDSQNYQPLIEFLSKYRRSYPSDVWAIEELAEIYLKLGMARDAADLRNTRKTIDQILRDYTNLVGSDFRANAGQLATMSETLGRWFETYAFRMIDAQMHPESRISHETSLKLLEEIQLAESVIDLNAILRNLPQAQLPNEISTGMESSQKPRIPVFENITENSGVHHTFQSGKTELRQLPETMSGGLGLIDFDNDGWMDIILLQGGVFPPSGSSTGQQAGDRLLRNLADGTFADITEQAGLPATSQGYSHGVTVGDVNRDGFDDIFITRYGSYTLYLNQKNGTFSDATKQWNLDGGRDWPTSAAFADFDNDGDLDLYVCHYVVWNSEDPRICGNENGGPISYCVPHVLSAQPDHLFRNDGEHFTDISLESGITKADSEGRGLGVVTADFDDDGLIDIFVANDGTANFLFKNLGNLQFENVAFESGVAANSNGGFQAGMGVGCGDYNRDLKLDLFVTNFYGESTSYFENMGKGLFRERGAGIGLKDLTRYKLGFGTAITDFNNDMFPDIFSVNGHVNDLSPVIPYQMTPQILFGQADGKLNDPGQSVGMAFEIKSLGRGLVTGDLNNDGLQDAIQLSLDSPVLILRNSGFPDLNTDDGQAGFLTLKLIGVRSNRNAIGAKVTAIMGDQKIQGYCFGGGSYQSAGDRRLHLGLGRHNLIDRLEIQWPSGTVDRFENISTNQGLVVTEGDRNLKKIPGFK